MTDLKERAREIAVDFVCQGGKVSVHYLADQIQKALQTTRKEALEEMIRAIETRHAHMVGIKE